MGAGKPPAILLLGGSMRVMIFIDDSNFFKTIKVINKERSQDRVIDYHKVNQFVINFLQKNSQYAGMALSHVRTYLYDGEYTDALLNRIKRELTRALGDEQKKIQMDLDRAVSNSKGQKSKLKRLDSFNFLEVRLKPLQFSRKAGIFQKGVDVQLAVDLVSGAYLNTYDIAVVFSGDIDLLESVKLVKNLGKHVAIFSHYSQVAVGMRKHSDFCVDLQRFDDSELDAFTHQFQKKA